MTPNWWGLFHRASVINLPITSSDHAPLFLDMVGGSQALASPFRFEEFWVKEPDCLKVVSDAWLCHCVGSPTMRFCQKIRFTKLS